MFTRNTVAFGVMPGRGDGGEVDDRVDAVVVLVERAEEPEHLAHVLEVGGHERRARVGRGDAIRVHHVVAVLDQVADAGAAQLAAAAGDDTRVMMLLGFGRRGGARGR